MKSTKPASKSSEDRNKNVRLVKIDTDNFDAMTHLSVDDTQKGFLVENIYSLAEAYATLAEEGSFNASGSMTKRYRSAF